MNLAKIWQLFRSSQQRSSRAGHARRNRPQLAVESLEGRAMPSTLLPATAPLTGLIDPVASETVGRNFFGPNVNTFSIIIEIPSSRVAGEVSPTKLSSAGETGTRGSVSDDVGVDGRSITAQNPAMALSQNGRLNIGSGCEAAALGDWGNDWLGGGTGQDVQMANGGAGWDVLIGTTGGDRRCDGSGRDVLIGSFINDIANSRDDNSHGTHVAGTIGAMGNNGLAPVGWGNDWISGGTGQDAIGRSGTSEWKYIPIRRVASSSVGGSDSTARSATDDTTSVSEDGGDADGTIAVGGYIRVKKLTS